jgi:hypothetical protein
MKNRESSCRGLFFAAYYDANVRDAANAMERLGCCDQAPMLIVLLWSVGRPIDRFQETLKQGCHMGNRNDSGERKRINRDRRAKLGEEFLSLNRDSPSYFRLH